MHLRGGGIVAYLLAIPTETETRQTTVQSDPDMLTPSKPNISTCGTSGSFKFTWSISSAREKSRLGL